MIIAPSSVDTNLSQLLLEASIGKIQLPEFQRSWTWDDDRIKGILASLSQGYPMGAIMRLQYGNPDIKFRYRTLEGIEGVNEEPEYLILDGQQRLTSMYQALYDDRPVKTVTDKKMPIQRYYYLEMKMCLDEYEDREDAVLSIPADKKLKENFDRDVVKDLSTTEQEYENQCFPLNLVFHPSKLTNWCTGYVLHYAMKGDPQKAQEATEIYTRFKTDVIDTITGYKLPVITLDKTTPREAVCKVFENVNTGGVPLTVFELVTASFATNEFNLRDDWLKCRAIIRGEGELLNTDLLNGIDETAFLTTVTLYISYIKKVNGLTGMVSCKKRDVLDLSYEDYNANKDIVLQGYRIAREFLLKYQFVFRQRDLPYPTQIVPLAAICAYLGRSKCNEPNTTRILSQWYWCGILGEMYGSANETRYANDIEDVVNEVFGRPSLNRTVNASFFSSTRLLTMQSRLSAAYKGVLALLYKEQCRDFMNDTTIDIVNSMVESPDIHHIFPQKYCEKQHIKRQKYNSIVNKTPLLPETNRAIGGEAPSVYTQRILKKVKGLTEETLRERIESHLVNYNALIADDFDAYFVDRAKKMLDLIESAMGKKVADRGAENTIEQFGASLMNKM